MSTDVVQDCESCHVDWHELTHFMYKPELSTILYEINENKTIEEKQFNVKVKREIVFLFILIFFLYLEHVLDFFLGRKSFSFHFILFILNNSFSSFSS